jgi:hypothetical protein
MAELKTKRTRASVTAFLSAIPDPDRRKDARAVAALLRRVTGDRPAMWGSNMVGFGKRRLRYASGREIDWMVAAFAPRGDRITLYLTCDLSRHREVLGRLGRHARGKGCLHLRQFSDVDPAVLEELVRCAVDDGGGGAGHAPADQFRNSTFPDSRS